MREFVSELMVQSGVFHFVFPATHTIKSVKFFIAKATLVFLRRSDFLEVGQAVSEPVGEAREGQQAIEEIEGALEHDVVAQRSYMQRALMVVLEESSSHPEIAVAQR